MRAGPLSRQKIIDYLNKHFVNTSIILPELRNPDEYFSNPTARRWAEAVHQEFSYPVDSIVLSSEGKPLSQLSFEEIFGNIMQGKLGKSYSGFLREALDSPD